MRGRGRRRGAVKTFTREGARGQRWC